jgi:hypothetical protein
MVNLWLFCMLFSEFRKSWACPFIAGGFISWDQSKTDNNWGYPYDKRETSIWWQKLAGTSPTKIRIRGGFSSKYGLFDEGLKSWSRNQSMFFSCGSPRMWDIYGICPFQWENMTINHWVWRTHSDFRSYWWSQQYGKACFFTIQPTTLHNRFFFKYYFYMWLNPC